MAMTRVFDATINKVISMPAHKTLPCGSRASVDREACYPAYRCDVCGAVDGSVGVPSACREEENSHD